MIRIPYTEVIGRIKEKTGISEEEVQAKIEAKLKQLSGLISKDGAAYIVANELGVKLLESTGKIKDVFPGMRTVEICGKVQQVYEVKQFTRQDNTMGKVGSFVAADETGALRVVCWGNQTDTLSQLKEGTIVKITNGMAKESNRGYKEVHLNDNSRIVIDPKGVTIGEVKTHTKKTIKELNEDGQQTEIMGTILQVFDIRYFTVCPQCNGKLKQLDGQWHCDTHQSVTPDHSYVLNLFLDDGTDTVRCVFFRNQAEKLLNKNHEACLQYMQAPEQFETVKNELLGNIVRLVGRARKNEFSDKLEFVVQQVHHQESISETVPPVANAS